MITLDPNQTNDQPVQDQTGVTTPTDDQIPQTPVVPETQVPVSEPTAEPTAPIESGPFVPAEPVAVPEPTPNAGNMDGDTTPPIPGV